MSRSWNKKPAMDLASEQTKIFLAPLVLESSFVKAQCTKASSALKGLLFPFLKVVLSQAMMFRPRLLFWGSLN